jgi:dTDP-glucose pyrophosphorylase
LIGYFGDGHRFGCHISYVVQEPVDQIEGSTSPGLAHALNAAYHLTRGKTVCFGMADTVMRPVEIFSLALRESAPEDDVILVLFPTEHPEKFGMVRLGEDDRVLEIVDKPRFTDLTEMWGAITWRQRFTEYLHDCVSRQEMTDFAVIMNSAMSDGLSFRGVHIREGIYIDLGTYDEIMELDRRFRDA